MQNYSFDAVVYESGQFVKTDCNSIQFINYGSVPVIIERVIVLQQNQTFEVNGNHLEVLVKEIQLSFSNAVGIKNCVVIRKNYV